MQAFLIAVRFLTRLPCPQPSSYQPELIGRSLVFYPLVGLLLGSLLWLSASWGEQAPTLLGAALILALWVFLTGALHLDGLADSADAWIGGLGDRERTLAIMKDPRSGPAAVVVLVLLLLLKFTALAALLGSGQEQAVLVAVVLGRTSLPALFLTTPYVRQGGLGQALANHLPRQASWITVMVAVVAVIVVWGWTGIIAATAAGLTLCMLRRAVLRRLGGTTGDTSGALVELVECVVLVVWAL